MAAIACWQESGFAPLGREYLAKLVPGGSRTRLGDNGDLLIGDGGAAVESHSLVAALRAPSWLDPVTGAPSLGPQVWEHRADE
jgi:hypothetical protein